MYVSIQKCTTGQQGALLEGRMHQCVGMGSSRVGSKETPPHSVTKAEQSLHFLHFVINSAPGLQACLLLFNRNSSTRSRYRSIHERYLEHNWENIAVLSPESPKIDDLTSQKNNNIYELIQNRQIGIRETSKCSSPLTRWAHHSKTFTHKLFSDIFAENERKMNEKNVFEERISETAKLGFNNIKKNKKNLAELHA